MSGNYKVLIRFLDFLEYVSFSIVIFYLVVEVNLIKLLNKGRKTRVRVNVGHQQGFKLIL